MTTPLLAPEAPALGERASRIAALLDDYPASSARDIDEIVDFLRTGPLIEVGGLGRDDRVRDRLRRFRQDQRRRLTPGWLASLVFALAVLVPIALVCAWFTVA